MRTLIIITLSILLLISCKQTKKEIVASKPLTITEKIAHAHGYENWQHVSRIDFTFNVDKDSSHTERSWAWEPKTNTVIFLAGEDSIIVYNRNLIDSTKTQLDKRFINDKYWLLIPFQLVWDKETSITNPKIAEAPISKTQMNKITITYPNEGGYTPGDAYDIFYGNDFLIKEWIFRKANALEPTLTNTFEKYQDYNGLKLAMDHKKSNDSWSLNFSNIKVILDSNH